MLLATLAVLAATAAPPPFQPLSRADYQAAKVAETGCTWGSTSKGPWLFAAADDRATVKRAGRLLPLKPGAGAKDMFPFTYDRWESQGLAIVVRESGKSKPLGSEGISTPAFLDVTEGRRTRSWRGILQCGS